jgi:arylsulfatase
MEKAQKDDKPFFVWLNPTRMHVFTYLSPKYEALKTPENGWSLQEAGMAQFDDIIGSVMKKLEDMGVADNTIIVVTTDNGTETFTWPDGGTTPFKGEKGMGTEGGFRAPSVIHWPGNVQPNQVINGVMSGMDWLPTFAAAAGNPNIKQELLKGKKLGGKKYKVHLDGYDQTDMLTKGGKSARDEFWYFTQSQLAAARIGDFKYVLLDQPDGWLGQTIKLNFPKLYNLRLDPFERMGFGPGESFMSFKDFYGRNFWRFVFLQQEVGKLAKTAIEYPPMQAAASFNLDAVKAQIATARAAHAK